MRKGNKRCSDWEGRNKTVLFTNDMSVYVENIYKKIYISVLVVIVVDGV